MAYSSISPDGRDYNIREQWNRTEWRNIHRRNLRMCPGCYTNQKPRMWHKIETLIAFNGLCQRCRQEATTDVGKSK